MRSEVPCRSGLSVRLAASGGLMFVLIFPTGCGGGDGQRSVDAEADPSDRKTDARGTEARRSMANDTGPDGGVDAALQGGADAASAPALDAAGEGGALAPGEEGGPPSLLAPTALLSPMDGSRLKIAWYQSAEDGTKVFATWRDTMLGVYCLFDNTLDSSWRCRPDAIVESVERFLDARCTKRVHAWPRGASTSGYVLIARPNVCPAERRIFRRTKRSSEILYYEKRTDGACIVGQRLFNADDEIYELETVSPATFVGAEAKPGKAAGGLLPLMLESSDGARSFLGWRNAADGKDCLMTRSSDGSVRCLPRPVATPTRSFFADAACTLNAAWGSLSSCVAPDYLWHRDDTVCPTRTAVFRAGPRVATVFQKSTMTDACSPASSQIQQTFRFFGIGEEMAAASFPGGVTTGIFPSDGRLAVLGESTAAGTTSRAFYDKKLQTPCSVGRAADGQRRCLPTELPAAEHFADSLCSEPVVEVFGACQPTMARTFDSANRTRVHRVTGRHSGPLFWQSGGSCRSTTVAATATYHSLGPEIPAGEFAPVSLVVP
jgi:hypothetical protein